ncbi:MAG: hypothetical protein ACLR9I_05030 [Eisenbergiella sp.]
MPKVKILLNSSKIALTEIIILPEEGKETSSPVLIKVAKVNMVAIGVNRSSKVYQSFCGWRVSFLKKKIRR